jgi:DNA polymerase/3'-5' exonuclease PolX
MSGDTRHHDIRGNVEYPAALEITTRAQAALALYCHRISIAGSIRRQRPQVKDIEIVALPWQEPSDLFGDVLVAHPGFAPP